MKAYTALTAVGALAAVILVGGWTAVNTGRSDSGGMIIKASDVGSSWPLTVPEIKIECGDDLAIYAKYGDKTFPLNGQAERLSMFYKKSPVTRLEDIQKDDLWTKEFVPGAKMSMDPVNKLAIQHCQTLGRWMKA
jgi:hypothetical protein